MFSPLFFVVFFSPNVDYLPENFYQVDLLVVPKWGLYANMIAQLISQISSHYIIHYHRRLVDDALNRHIQRQSTVLGSEDQDSDINTSVDKTRIIAGRPTPINSEAEKLCNHAFRRKHRGESDNLVARRFVAPLLICLAFLLSILFILGCVLPTFAVDILGVAGVLVESGQSFTAADTSYSIFTMIRMLFDQAKLTGGAGDYLGLGTLGMLVILSVLFVPIAQAIALLVQWFVALTQIQRHRLSILLEILQAWQYAEVYLLAILVASWQLGPISGKFRPTRYIVFLILF